MTFAYPHLRLRLYWDTLQYMVYFSLYWLSVNCGLWWQIKSTWRVNWKVLLLVNCCKFNILLGPNLLWLRMIQWYMKNNLQSKCHLPIEQRLKLLYWRGNLWVNLTVSASPASQRLNVGNLVWKLGKIGLLVSLSEPDLVPRVNAARFSLLFKLYLNFRRLLSHHVMRLLSWSHNWTVWFMF